MHLASIEHFSLHQTEEHCTTAEAGESPSDLAWRVIVPSRPNGRRMARHLPRKVLHVGSRKLATSLGLAFPTAASSPAPSTWNWIWRTISGTGAPAASVISTVTNAKSPRRAGIVGRSALRRSRAGLATVLNASEPISCPFLEAMAR